MRHGRLKSSCNRLFPNLVLPPPRAAKSALPPKGIEFMGTPTEQTFSRPRNAIRLITLWNFLLFALFVIPPTNRWISRGFLSLRAVHLEEPAGRSLQVWLVGSTLLATALLGWMLWQKRRATSAGLPSVSVGLEGVLVAVWWLVVLGASAYGFALGMGG